MKKSIIQLIHYALNKKLISHEDIDKSIDCLTKVLDEPSFDFVEMESIEDIEDNLNKLIEVAYEKSLIPSLTIDEKDAFEALLFNCIMPEPHQVKDTFSNLMNSNHAIATQYLYKLSKDVNYIKSKRLKQNLFWTYEGQYGHLQMTINLAKPEKDPKEIAQAKDLKSERKDLFVPKCVLCKENEQNYYNARMNLRIVPISLGNELWHFQYSPYSYYQEHAIILHDQHKPMKISDKTFRFLLDFEDMFPSYFMGSNADLPIVGGSILNHDHFQAGHHQFPIQDARPIKTFGKLNYVDIAHIKWPLSTIRLSSENKEGLIQLASFFLDAWKSYTNEALDLLAFTDQTPHNTITPIARKSGRMYELDLILRNNRTTKEHPYGLFHPHEVYHHIKKENIGLIEAMGLAILPGRLKKELNLINEWLNHGGEIHPDIEKHKTWMKALKNAGHKEYSESLLYREVGKIFEHILENCGVFKLNEMGNKALHTFITDTMKKFTHR